MGGRRGKGRKRGGEEEELMRKQRGFRLSRGRATTKASMPCAIPHETCNTPLSRYAPLCPTATRIVPLRLSTPPYSCIVSSPLPPDVPEA